MSWFALVDPFDEAFSRFSIDVSLRRAMRLLQGHTRVVRKPRLALMEEGKFGDFIWTDLVIPRIISSRVVEALKESSSTGWGTYPVKFADVSPEHSYFGLSVKGRASSAYVGTNASTPVVPRGSTIENDVSLIPGTAWILLSERTVTALRAANVTNAAFAPVPIQ